MEMLLNIGLIRRLTGFENISIQNEGYKSCIKQKLSWLFVAFASAVEKVDEKRD
jgi:hypothetical protein